MKTFILLSAVPGAGKSTWALQYKKTHPHVFIVSSDDIRKELTGVYQNWDKNKKYGIYILEELLNIETYLKMLLLSRIPQTYKTNLDYFMVKMSLVLIKNV